MLLLQNGFWIFATYSSFAHLLAASRAPFENHVRSGPEAHQDLASEAVTDLDRTVGQVTALSFWGERRAPIDPIRGKHMAAV